MTEENKPQENWVPCYRCKKGLNGERTCKCGKSTTWDGVGCLRGEEIKIEGVENDKQD